MRNPLRLLLALLVSFCFILPLQAQITKGSMLLGGSISYTRNHSQIQDSQSGRRTGNYQNLGLAPIAGYFVADNLVVGTSLSGSMDRTVQDDKLSNKSYSWGVGPFARYYKFIGEKIAFFGQAGFGFSQSTYKNRNAAGEFEPYQKFEQFNISAQPGISYFPIPRLGFQLTMGSLGYYKTDAKYQISQPENPSAIVRKSIGANFGLNQLAVGINVLFSK